MQIINLTWKKAKKLYNPVIEILNDDKELFVQQLQGYHFNYKLSDVNYCIGYYAHNKYYPCQNEISNKYQRCAKCEEALGFRGAFLFGKDPNENAKKYLAQDHYIYLAYFEPGIIKVGTCSNSRKQLRMIEQDAQVFIYIAKSDGFNISKVEKYLSQNFTLKTAIQNKHKFKYLTTKIDYTKAKQLLLKQYQTILKKEDKYLNQFLFKPNQVEAHELISLISSSSIEFVNEIHNPKFVSGEFYAFRGKWLILNQQKKLIAFALNNLIGKKLTIAREQIFYEIKETNTQLELF